MICQRCAKEKSGIHTCTPSDLVRTLEQQNAELVAALKDWDTLIKYNYSGSRDAMSAMQICAFNTKDILDKVKQP